MTFTTTLFALIRDNLKINVRESAEMDQVKLLQLPTEPLGLGVYTEVDQVYPYFHN